MPDVKPSGIVVPGLKPAPAGDWWNTGCKVINNRTDRVLYVMNLETRGWGNPVDALLPIGQGTSFTTIVPWCNSIDEVATRAFSFHDGTDINAPRLFYLWQNYNDDRVNWCPADADAYTDRIEASNVTRNYIDIFIEAVGVPPDVKMTPRVATPSS
jgi:hypothetical protein